MSDESHAFLVVEKGAPYSAGQILPLRQEKVLLGRSWMDHHPDISFKSPYVSRSHALVENAGGTFGLLDLPESRHGTTVNGAPLAKATFHSLRHGDRIELAKGEVILVFCSEGVSGETLDYSVGGPKPRLHLHEERREVTLDGRALPLTGKPYELFHALWSHRGNAVDDAAIRKAVWPERAKDDQGIPLVDDEEIATLVHRLRGQLGGCGALIRTIRGYGYLLDMER